MKQRAESGCKAAVSEIKDRLRDEGGGAIILAVLVSMVVLGVGAVALTVARTEMKVTANHNRGVLAKYHAESQLQRTVGLQNDLTASPRWLFNPSRYSYRATGPSDTSRVTLQSADAPLGGGTQNDGTVLIRVIGKDPVTQSPPYTIQARSDLLDGSSATYQAVVDVISLLDFALFSDARVYVGSNITISGRMYSGDDIFLTGPNANFLQRLEYVDQLINAGYGTFQQGYGQVPALPSIPALVDLTFFENASKNAGVCSQGRGLYIGYDGSPTIDNQTNNLFRAYEGGSPANNEGWGDPYHAGCRTGTCFAVDLGLFDFSVSPITYGGNVVLGYDGQPLGNFNGVIWADDEIHVWGHLGGRSPEENTVTDTQGYINPPFLSPNLYSNNVLDTGEDGNNGWPSDGQLQSLNRGVSLGIYGDDHILIDHNIFAGADSIGNPVRMALVARNSIRIDGYSPRMIRIESAMLAVGATWDPEGNHNSHRKNYWANLNGDLPPNSYVYDIDWDGTIETNNGYNSGDRNETSMKSSMGLQNLGNLVVRTSPNSGHWASHAHPRFYTYDTQLQTAEIPCYPTLPNYGIVPGSFTEVLNAP